MFTEHLGRQRRRFFYQSWATYDLALEEHVTTARLDTPPPPVVGGAAPCAYGLGSRAVRVQESWLLVAALAGRGESSGEAEVT